ncbi:bifunctional diaminohydroxyphosphoribosylaminopyrimidine deaminase/5-amino-6-(5-phosphoribosylamino)uracil reductase RibD [soil metagenome]
MTGTETDDLFWMRRALAEAALGLGFVEPNPLVGALVVSAGKTVGIGHHPYFGGPHAEVVALARAGEAARGATLYVTLEPCCHFGKTPPCTEAIIRAGIARVVAAMRDPFPRVAGEGFEELRDAGIVVESGLDEAASRRLNAPYLKRLATGMPYVTAKWAMTLDGKTACASGDSRWISSTRSRGLVHELRGRVDGLLVGIGTAMADDPELTARPAGPRQAARIVLDPAARLPTASRLACTAHQAPVWVAVTDRAPLDRREALRSLGCDLLEFPGEDRVPILPLLAELGRRGQTNLLVEGGGRVLGAFLDAGQVDAVEVYMAPILEGGSQAFQPIQGRGFERMAEALRLDRHEVQVIDGDVLVRGTITREGPSPTRSA